MSQTIEDVTLKWLTQREYVLKEGFLRVMGATNHIKIWRVTHNATTEFMKSCILLFCNGRVNVIVDSAMISVSPTPFRTQTIIHYCDPAYLTKLEEAVEESRIDPGVVDKPDVKFILEGLY